MPQCASETFTPKRRLRSPVRIGLPMWRLSHGIASPWIVPSNREPITRSSPRGEPLDERRELARAGTSRPRLPSRRTRRVRVRALPGRRFRSPAVPRGRRSPRARRRSRAEPSVDALSTTITSPGRPEPRRPPRPGRRPTPTASSSFRHGITTEISGCTRPLSATTPVASGHAAGRCTVPRRCRSGPRAHEDPGVRAGARLAHRQAGRRLER